MIDRIDHVVLTVQSLEATCEFYAACLDFERVDTPGRPTALHFGRQKINVHEAGHTFDPKARHPTSGSADLCFVAAVPLSDVAARLAQHRVPVELGPVERNGAMGPMLSIYFRDPDGNLIEVSNYSTEPTAR